MSHLSFGQQVQVISHLADRSSVLATQRQTGVEKKTISRLLLTVGEGCARLHNRLFQNLQCSLLQLDEQHSWVHTKQGHLKPGDPDEWGEQWCYLAIDARSRAAIAHRVGKRNRDETLAFAVDVRSRILGSPEIWADGMQQYPDAIQYAFGDGINFGRLIKPNQEEHAKESLLPEGPRRMIHKGERYTGAVKKAETGKPDLDKLTTNTIERQNLTTRQFQARLVRRTLSFSKSLAHHKASLSLHYTYSNLCWVLRTLRETPAMALGVTDHVWSVGDLVRAALDEPLPTPPAPPSTRLPKHSRWYGVDRDRVPDITRAPGTGRPMPPKLMLIKGGLS